MCLKMEGGKERSMALKQELKDIDLPFAHLLNAFEVNPEIPEGQQVLSTGNFSWQKEGR